MRVGDAGDDVGEQGHGWEATTRDRYGPLSVHRRTVKNREEYSDLCGSAVRRAVGQGALEAVSPLADFRWMEADPEKTTLSEVLYWPGSGAWPSSV